MRKLSLTLALATISAMSFGQIDEMSDFVTEKFDKTKNLDTVAWIYGGDFHLGVNQGMLHNWNAGGEIVSANVNGLFNGKLVRYNHRHSWTNNLEAAYGLFYAYSNDFIPRKTDDRIDLTSKYGYSLKKDGDLFFTILGNAKTQFTDAYDYNIPDWSSKPISSFLAPLYVTLAPGIEYRRGSNLSLFFSPIGARMTFASLDYTTRSPEGAFGIQHGKKSRFELGAYFTGRYEADLAENITYRTRLDLYSNYLAKDIYDDNNNLVRKDNPGNIDVLWDNQISFKFFKYFSLNVGVLAIYDNDIPYKRSYEEGGVTVQKEEPFQGLGWWQVNQTMSIGFNYKF